MFSSSNILLIATALTVGLSAGLLFAYSASVNPGLRELPDDAYLAAMQGINRAIQNGYFFAVYFAPVLLLPLCCRSMYQSGQSFAFRLLVAATALYLIGVAGVTIGGNVPLNNALEAFRREGADAGMLRRAREAFEGPWNGWHAVRTWAAVLSFAAVLAAMTIGAGKRGS